MEVGSGRGGGARYIARYFEPAEVVGVDFSPTAIKFANRHSRDVDVLRFQIGDAAALPFQDASFDVVVNVESSHCYPDVAAFAREVARVLAPGGTFTFADMRSPEMLPALDRDLAVPGMRLELDQDITAGVVAGLDAAEGRKRERLQSVWFMRRFMAEFAGVQGSLLYQALSHNRVVYVARRYVKLGEAT